MNKALPATRSLGLLLVVILLLFVAPASAQEPDQDFTILLKSRQFVPAPGMDKAMAAQLSASPTGRSHVLIQFDHIPTAEEREALEGAGVKLLAYVPHNAWFASVPATVSLGDRALASARWLGSILPQDKLAAGLWEGQVGSWAVNADGSVSLYLLFFADVPFDEARRIIAAHGGHVEKELPEFHRLRVRAPRQAITALAGEDGVQWVVEVPPPKVPVNDGSRARTNVNDVQAAPYNLSGSGVDLGIWDEGSVYTHADFSGRLTVVDTVGTSNHSTHVAGTMAGDGANSAAQGGSAYQWKGMAPGADIISYDWNNSVGEHNGAINTYGIELSQNSWGLWIDESLWNNCSLYGDYDHNAPDYDWIVTGRYGKRLVVVFAAGNERNDCDCGMSCSSPYINYGNIIPPGTAKNVITVGATNSNDDSMTWFSSWGPVDDGRVKPDVVAPGDEVGGDWGIKSTYQTASYVSYEGTSMAAPAVSGISALLIEQYRSIYGGADPWPSTVKALLIHTAVDLNDATSYYNPGPDYASGYGRVDAKAAVDMIREHPIITGSISSTGQTDVYYVPIPSGETELKATLVWDDRYGALGADPALVNDLDLALIDPDGGSHYPWVLNPSSPSNSATKGVDHTNNVEQVQVSSPSAGLWQIRVSGYSVPYPSQGYSLVSGNLSPLSVSVSDGVTFLSSNITTTLTYTIDYASPVTDTTGVVLTATRPVSTTYVSSNPPFSTVDGTFYTRAVGTLSAGDVASATFTIQVPLDLPKGTSIEETVSIWGNGAWGSVSDMAADIDWIAFEKWLAIIMKNYTQ